MVELENLSAGYGAKPVLQEVSIAFRPGEVLALIGPNGSGKSTLLKAALGLIPKAGGRVLYDGQDISTLSPREIAQKAAYLAQSRPVPNITARRMVLHGRFPYLSYPRQYTAQDKQIVDEAMRQTGALAFANRPVPELSGGQRQQVYLAMALAQQTETIFMDEPTTYLDVAHQLEVMDTAKKLAAAGRAVVLVAHDLPLALEGADRAAVLADGRLVAAGTPEEIFCAGVLEKVFGTPAKRVSIDGRWRYFFGE